MSFEYENGSNLEKLARAKRVENTDGSVIRAMRLDPVRLDRARKQVNSDGERKAIGRHWWEKVDVHALPPAPAGWPIDWQQR